MRADDLHGLPETVEVARSGRGLAASCSLSELGTLDCPSYSSEEVPEEWSGSSAVPSARAIKGVLISTDLCVRSLGVSECDCLVLETVTNLSVRRHPRLSATSMGPSCELAEVSQGKRTS